MIKLLNTQIVKFYVVITGVKVLILDLADNVIYSYNEIQTDP